MNGFTIKNLNTMQNTEIYIKTMEYTANIHHFKIDLVKERKPFLFLTLTKLKKPEDFLDISPLVTVSSLVRARSR